MLEASPAAGASRAKQAAYHTRLAKDLRRHYPLYLFILPAFVVIAIFNYAPMYGVIIAFKNFKPIQGITGSAWVGLKNFEKFFSGRQIGVIFPNTLALSFFGLIAGFPCPIILALMLNQIKSRKYKRVIQTVTYMPHFISVVVLCGMVLTFLNNSTGLYANIARLFGVAKPANILADASKFRAIYIISGIWQNAGWDSVIYLAALAGIDPTLYEAATVDGATNLQKIRHIDLPGLRNVMMILLILSLGGIMSIGFEKVLLLQNDRNAKVSEIIATYVYKIGLRDQQQYSLSAAVGLFNTVVNFALLLTTNFVSKKVTETGLF